MQQIKKRIGLITYIKQAREEILKVTWPSRSDTVKYSFIVIGASLFVVVFFMTSDFFLDILLKQFIALAK